MQDEHLKIQDDRFNLMIEKIMKQFSSIPPPHIISPPVPTGYVPISVVEALRAELAAMNVKMESQNAEILSLRSRTPCSDSSGGFPSFASSLNAKIDKRDAEIKHLRTLIHSLHSPRVSNPSASVPSSRSCVLSTVSIPPVSSMIPQSHSPNCRLGLTSLHPIYFILAVLIVLNILAWI